MKKIILSIAACILLSISYAQEAPKQSTVVIVSNPEVSSEDMFAAAVQVLKTDGYSFDEIDKEFMIGSTKPTKPKRIQMEYRIDFSATSNQLHIRSFVKTLTNLNGAFGGVSNKEETWERGANRSAKTSLWRIGWNKQLEIAQKVIAITGGELQYKIDE